MPKKQLSFQKCGMIMYKPYNNSPISFYIKNNKISYRYLFSYFPGWPRFRSKKTRGRYIFLNSQTVSDLNIIILDFGRLIQSM